MSDDEGAYDLRDVSSDVEIEPEEFDSDARYFEQPFVYCMTRLQIITVDLKKSMMMLQKSP